MRMFTGLIALLLTGVSTALAAPPSDFFALQATDIDGKSVPLSKYRGKTVLVVNTASQCGFTSQYEGLQDLYTRYQERGLVVMGFPANDFGGQEPGDNAQIKKFCESQFKVTFPLFSKAPVKGPAKQPVFIYLTEGGPSALRREIRWNFEKFLISRDGQLVSRFGSITAPLAGELTQAIEAELKRPVKALPAAK